MYKNSLKKILVVAMAIMMVLALTACSDRTKMLGKWNIISVSAGDMEMTSDDIQDLGLSTSGYLKLNKSGNCVVDLLGDEYKGTWELGDDGVATIKYDKDKTGTAVRDDDTMTFTDADDNVYTLKK